jgi:hypothetical protein
MEKDSLKKSYQNRNSGNKDATSYFTGGSNGDFLKNLKEKDEVKPQPQAKPKPKDVEATSKNVEATPKKNDPERDALLSAFNEKYGVLNLKGKEYDENLARFSEKWNADKDGYGKAEPRKDSKKDSGFLAKLLQYGSRDYSGK